jgi:hypothetical protein
MSRKPIRPQIFIGSSSSTSSKDIAYAIQQNLDADAEITVWDQNVFRLTKNTLESLFEQLTSSKFAIFVFSPDDIVHINGKTLPTVRDNIILELGLFMGRLGRDHTFIVTPQKGKLRIPSDLFGISVGHYNPSRQDRNLQAALGPFCHNVRLELQKLGFGGKARSAIAQPPKRSAKRRLQIIEALYGFKDHRVNVAHKLNSLIRNDRLHVFVGNQLGGDPCPGEKKNVVVKYSYKGVEEIITVPERKDLDIPPKSEFIEVFDEALQHWDYKGAWTLNNNELLVTNSEFGGIAKPCGEWTDYIFEFETKILNKFSSWIVRAPNPKTYVMLQCQPHRLYPHFCLNEAWINLDWTNKNPIVLPVAIPTDTWFGVRIKVKGFNLDITIKIDGRDISIPIAQNLLRKPIAPIEYSVGSIGFRGSGDEAALFRNITVQKIIL